MIARLWLLFSLAALCLYAQSILYGRSATSGVGMADLEGDDFRAQRFNEELLGQMKKRHPDFLDDALADTVTATMLMGRFSPEKVCADAPLFKRYKNGLWKEGRRVYQAVWGDVECFPVSGTKSFYEDSWLSPRGDGQRRHEGCDLFGEEDEPGLYPVASMTRGKVEQAGWLPLGGYRIGVRSPSGGYFYYAHLDSYERDYKPGDEVKAGQILGFMGNTGYGPKGTAGEFPTHLHLGIYVRTRNYEELSVNPYWVLRFLDS